VLHFLKVYPTEDCAARVFGFHSRTTYRTKLWRALEYLDVVMDEIHLEDRLKGPVASSGIFKDISMIVDGTDCPINTPFASKEERLRFFCGRNKDNTNSRYNLKYTIGVSVSTGRIVAVLGPEPGSIHDITAIRNSDLIGVILSKNPYEVVLADKGYIGEPIFLTPFKPVTGHGLSPQLEAVN